MLIAIGSMLGGLGLFLLAMKMISEGLRLAAGQSLRDILGRWTYSPLRGLAAGSGITAIVQSSSAVTVATIGFVNAGLLDLYHALGVVYGANVGTTVTGWLVAAIGFKIKVEAFALPMIGIGMFMRLSGADERRGAIGEALAGFGLFFIGIDILRGAFEAVAANMHIPDAASKGVLGTLLFVGFGFLMTVLTQSSSAAIALILTAATGGVINLNGAAAMVIGANVGTTSTAVFAAIGATPNAKRVAAAHILFNIVTGIVALLLLPIILWLVARTSDILGLEKVPAVTLALFHTLFNLIGVLLMWPMTARLSQVLGKRFRSIEEIEGRPKYLDKTVAVSPFLALDAATLELIRVNDIARRMAMGVLSSEGRDRKRMRTDLATLEKLNLEIGKFITHLERGNLPAEVARHLTQVLRIGQHYSQVGDLANLIWQTQREIKPLLDPETDQLINHFKARVIELISACDLGDKAFSYPDCENLHADIETGYHDLKAAILQSGVTQRLELTNMNNTLEQLSHIRRMLNQLMKGVRRLVELRNQINMPEKKSADTLPEPDGSDNGVTGD